MTAPINIMEYGTAARDIYSFRPEVTNMEEAIATSIIMQETEDFSQEQLRHVYNLFEAQSDAILQLANETKRSRLPPEMMCLICLDRPRDVVFMKCFHRLVCQYCQTDYKSCPVCHQPIKAFRVV